MLLNQSCRLSGIWVLLLIAGCTDDSVRFAGLVASDPPEEWTGIEDHEPCFMKLNRARRPSIRVNCFTIDGVLHTHSHRFVDYYQAFGESWVHTVARDKRIRVLIRDKLYDLEAHLQTDEERRLTILKNRGYDPVPDGIRVFMLLPPNTAEYR